MPSVPSCSPAESAWRAKCPLRKWLTAQKKQGGETMITLCEKLNARRQTAYSWLYGMSLPRPEMFVALREHCGIDFYSWMSWFEKRPKEAQRAESKD